MYKPTTDLLEGIRNAFPQELFPWDDYFARMAETDWKCHGVLYSTKSFFIRKAPFGGSFALLGGITAALRELADLRFDSEDFQAGMRDMGYNSSFCEWLKKRKRLKLRVYAPPEGSIFFPHEPVVTFDGPIPDVRLAEGIFTEAINFATLCLTKWERFVRTVMPGSVLDFGRRRAQHSLKSSLASVLAGCVATSNAELKRFFDVEVRGTMGHEWMQSFGDVKTAFEAWLTHQPMRPMGLVDTKQCLAHDFPAWLDAVYLHREAIRNASPPFWGWRNDSGDLADLAIEQYKRLIMHPLSEDPWFARNFKIMLTNDLDEYAASSIIKQIKDQTVDAEHILSHLIWAAGTKPGTCEDQPSLGGVAKLVSAFGSPCIKLAFDAEGRPGEKTSIPGDNFSALIQDSNGDLKCLLLYPSWSYFVNNEGQLCRRYTNSPISELVMHHPDNPGFGMVLSDYHATCRQATVFDSLYQDNFAEKWNRPDIKQVPKQIRTAVDALPWQMKRLEKPQVLPVLLTADLYELRKKMIEQGVLRADFLKERSSI